MSKSNFQLVFKVEVFHSYFENNTCSCLQFNWGPASNALAKRFDLRLRKAINGFEAYINYKGTLPEFLNYAAKVTGQTFFDFDICTDTAEFVNFTELPVNFAGQLQYDSKAAVNTYHSGVVNLGANLTNISKTNNVGSLVVHFDDVLKYSETQQHACFNINYKARSTQWQYYVINKSSLMLDELSITGKTDIKFNGPESVTIENGQQALLFSSGDTLIPLSDNPIYRFDLSSNPTSKNNSDGKKTGSSKIIFKGLPIPSPIRIRSSYVNNINQVTSPMYVYI